MQCPNSIACLAADASTRIESIASSGRFWADIQNGKNKESPTLVSVEMMRPNANRWDDASRRSTDCLADTAQACSELAQTPSFLLRDLLRSLLRRSAATTVCQPVPAGFGEASFANVAFDDTPKGLRMNRLSTRTSIRATTYLTSFILGASCIWKTLRTNVYGGSDEGQRTSCRRKEQSHDDHQ